jgi:hypothetical protein
MNSNSLKIVVLYDEEQKQFKPLLHNLSQEAAEEEIRKVGEQKLRAQILPQTRQHRGDGAQECRACRDAARKVSLPDSTEGEVLAGVPEADNAEGQGDEP